MTDAESTPITGIGELTTNDGDDGTYAALNNAALVISGDRVAWTGPASRALTADRAGRTDGSDHTPRFGRATFIESASRAFVMNVTTCTKDDRVLPAGSAELERCLGATGYLALRRYRLRALTAGIAFAGMQAAPRVQRGHVLRRLLTRTAPMIGDGLLGHHRDELTSRMFLVAADLVRA